MADLTNAEIVCLKLCLIYKTRELQLKDNTSNVGRKHFMKALGWDRNRVDLLMQLMSVKGLGRHDVAEGNMNVFWPSKLGINMIFDHIEGK